jgi:hypothetical protein
MPIVDLERIDSLGHAAIMPRIDLTDEKHAAVLAAVRKVIDTDRFPLSPRLKPLKSALTKLAPQSAKKPLPPPSEPGDGPRYGKGGTAKRERSRC